MFVPVNSAVMMHFGRTTQKFVSPWFPWQNPNRIFPIVFIINDVFINYFELKAHLLHKLAKYFNLKEYFSQKWKFAKKLTHPPKAIQDVDEFVSSVREI